MASKGMISVAMSRVLACRCPRDCLSGVRELCDGGWIDEGLVADTLVLEVLRRLRNYPSGAMDRGRDGASCEGLALSPELSVGAKERGARGWLHLWGGGWGAVCVSLSDGDVPLYPELTLGANGDMVDWYAPSPPGIVLQGGNEM